MELSGNSIDVALVKNEVSIPANFNSNDRGGGKFTGLLRKLTCEHQGAIIEHVYWGAELHKELRLAYDDGDIEKIKLKLNEIDNDLPELFQQAWITTVNILNNYFNLCHKNNLLPRMCVKAATTKDNIKYIVDLFREDGGKSNLSYKVEENTGFSSVEEDGRYYYCKNIPDAAYKGEYKNPRLDKKLAKKYKNGFLKEIKRRFSHNPSYDLEWAECWNDYSKDKENEMSCYKSTLIIPMTLMNNHQSSKFVKGTMVGVSKDARSIYGFLCFDHVDINYFTEDDINIGYIVADMLSHYMINELNFTTYSSVYENAKKRNKQ